MPMSQRPDASRSGLAQSWSPNSELGHNTLREHPNKRRRVENAQHHEAVELFLDQQESGPEQTVTATSDSSDSTATFAILVSQIDQRLSLARSEQGSSQIEEPRLTLLKHACKERDIFYLHLHALFCRWTLDRASFPSLPSYNLDAISMGFAILETILKKNGRLSKEKLAWFASFPYMIFTDTASGGLNNVVKQVADFLTALSENWTSLHQAVYNRHYPFLVDELLGRLQCYSKIMQNIFFTASRRRLGVQDGDLEGLAHQYFNQDQRQHLDENGQYKRMTFPADSAEVEARNHSLILKYRAIVTKARAEQMQRQQQVQPQYQEQQHSVPQQPMQSPQQQAQQFRQSHMPSTVQQRTAPQQLPLPGSTIETAVEAAPQVLMSNSQWAWNSLPGQIQNCPTAQMGPFPVASYSTTTHQTAQYPLQPQSAVMYASSGSATFSPNVLSPHTMQRQLNYLPSHVSMSNDMLLPTMSGPTSLLDAEVYAPSLQSPQAQMFSPQQQSSNLQDGAGPQQQASPRLTSTPWPTGMRSTNINPAMHMVMMGSLMSRQQPSYQAPPRPGIPHQSRTVQFRSMGRQQSEQRPGFVAAHNNVVQPLRKLVIPLPGYTIDRSDYPHNHQDRKALLMALHQCQARSPERTRADGGSNERFYQYVQTFAIAPRRLSQYHEIDFEVSVEDIQRLCKKKVMSMLDSSQAPHVREFTDKSTRFRVRCCRLQSEAQAAEPFWVTKEMSWPEHIFIQFNDQKLVIRRGTHNGKDQPVELTDFVVPGRNRLKVALSQQQNTSSKTPNNFYIAVEVVGIASHSHILQDIKTTCMIGKDETLAKIQSRVSAAPDEDGIAVVDRTGVAARDLSIDLTDPFSAKIFTIPARGAKCTHLECFDLETWLNTRPIKQQMKCGHRDPACTCPKRSEPSEPDKWKCPICFADARPGSLRIDSFLAEVRQQLDQMGNLDTKSILVAGDGTWRPVEELDDDDDDDDEAGSDGDEALLRGAAAKSQQSKISRRSVPAEKAPVEVIELD